MWRQRRMLEVKWTDKITNKEIFKELGEKANFQKAQEISCQGYYKTTNFQGTFKKQNHKKREVAQLDCTLPIIKNMQVAQNTEEWIKSPRIERH